MRETQTHTTQRYTGRQLGAKPGVFTSTSKQQGRAAGVFATTSKQGRTVRILADTSPQTIADASRESYTSLLLVHPCHHLPQMC